MTSGDDLMLLRELSDRLDVGELLEAHLADCHSGKKHPLHRAGLMRQRVPREIDLCTGVSPRRPK